MTQLADPVGSGLASGSSSVPDGLRIAVVHDWLTVYAGAERVLEQILMLFPRADLYCVCDFLPNVDRSFLQGRQPRTTFIQRLPGARKHYRQYLPLMPLAVEQLDLSGYNLIISSSHAVAKGVLTGPDQLHISYVHSPIRYAWDLQHQYLRESGLESGLKSWLARWMLHRIRLWDLRTANGVDCFVANSAFIARRIRKVYRRDARVIHPPVDAEAFPMREQKEEFYITASRLVPYKRVDAIVRAFVAMPTRRLKVVGDGPERAKIEGIAAGASNIEILGYCAPEEMAEQMARARALVFAAEEDFGIVPLEAQACGTPVIAYGKGGSLETVRAPSSAGADATGLFFREQTPEAIADAVDRFERAPGVFAPHACRRQAAAFSVERFRERLGSLIGDEWLRFQTDRAMGLGSDAVYSSESRDRS